MWTIVIHPPAAKEIIFVQILNCSYFINNYLLHLAFTIHQHYLGQ